MDRPRPMGSAPAQPPQTDPYQLLVESLHEHAVFLLDSTGRIVTWSPVAARLFGHDAASILGQSWMRFYPSANNRNSHPQQLLDQARTAGGHEVECQWVRQDGTLFWALVTLSPTTDQSGFAVVVRDVSASRRLHNTLRESEASLALAQRTAHFGSWELDLIETPLQVNTLRWSEECFRIFGYEPHAVAVTNDLFFSHVPSEEHEAIRAAVAHAIANHSEYALDHRLIRPDGSIRFVHEQAKVVVDPQTQTPIKLAGILHDITARKTAELKLEQEQQLLSAVLDHLPDYVYVKDTQSRYLLNNKANLHLMGRQTEAETLGKTVFDFFPASLAQAYTDDDRLVFANGVPIINREELIAGKDEESWRCLLTTKVPLRDTSGQITGLVGISRDVTVRKRAQEQLRESEELYHRLMDLLPTAVFVNTNNQITYCNPAFVQMMGATAPEQLLGKSPFTLFHPDFHPIIQQRIEQMYASQVSVPVLEEEMIRLDGTIVPVEVIATPVTLQGAAAILVLLHDLSERKRVQENFRLFVEGVKDYAICQMNAAGQIIGWNVGAELILGYSADEILGQHYARFFLADDCAKGVPESELHQARLHGRLAAEGWRMRKDGARFWANGVLTALYDRAGSVRGFCKITRDLSEKKRLEGQLQQSQKMEAIGQLAGGVAHDFNNLLTIISGYSELLLELKWEEGLVKESLQEIRTAGERAASLTRQLLAFSRQQVLEPKIVDLGMVVRETERMLARLIGEDIILRTVFDPYVHPVRVDPGQISQVILNLAVNARAAMPEGGELTIAVANVEFDDAYIKQHPEMKTRVHVRLSIQDNGSGMSDEIKAHIFEPFFTTKPVGQGSGLGLAVVYGIVAQSGGHIEVISAPDSGSTFNIYLPVVGSRLVGNGVLDPATLPRGTEAILLVEDEAGVRDLAALALETQGYRVIKARHGREALQMLASAGHAVDLLVTDVVMPELSGRKLAELVLARNPRTKVLFISGYTDDAIIRQGILHADVSFLQKPFTPASLAHKVRDVLDNT